MPPSRFALADDEDESDDDVAPAQPAESSSDALPLPMRDTAWRDLLSSGFASETKLAPSALTLSSVLCRAFVEEAKHRAEAVAAEEGATRVTEEHLEKVLPGLLLDFGP